jgi:hypothetical protein
VPDSARSRDVSWFGQEDNLQRSLRFVQSIQSIAASIEPWQRPSIDERLAIMAKKDGLTWELSVSQIEQGKSVLLKEILGEKFPKTILFNALIKAH